MLPARQNLADYCASGDGDLQAYRFPRAGTANAPSTLSIAEIDTANPSAPAVRKCLAKRLVEWFPFAEYMVRVGWLPDGNGVWAQLLDRSQKRIALAVFPLGAFQEPGAACKSVSSVQASGAWSRSAPLHRAALQVEEPFILLEDTSDIWINISNDLVFLDTDDGIFKFLWSTESSGHRHLELVESRGQPRMPPAVTR